MKLLKSPVDFDALLPEPLAIIYKHSTMCGLSDIAHREVRRFLSSHPDSEVHLVRVIEERHVSDHIAKSTGVRHESPQLLVLRHGRVVWHASHRGVTADAIATRL